MKFTKINIIHLIIYVTLVAVIVGGYFYFDNKINNLQDDLIVERNLRMALIDSVDYYYNRNQELVAEKLSLQVDISDLNQINNKLSLNQQELLSRLLEIKKEKDIIAAALVDMEFKVDSLLSDNIVTVLDSSVQFTKVDENINYLIRVDNVRPFGSYNPALYFEQISVFNRQFIEFHWEDNKDYGYPVSFSITNTNPYFVVNDVDSYIIPEIKKIEVKPTFWQRIGNTLNDGKKNAIWVGVGAGLMFLLTK